LYATKFWTTFKVFWFCVAIYIFPCEQPINQIDDVANTYIARIFLSQLMLCSLICGQLQIKIRHGSYCPMEEIAELIPLHIKF